MLGHSVHIIRFVVYNICTNLHPLYATIIGTGDDTRTWGPPFVNSESVYFMSINRNKKVSFRNVLLKAHSMSNQHKKCAPSQISTKLGMYVAYDD